MQVGKEKSNGTEGWDRCLTSSLHMEHLYWPWTGSSLLAWSKEKQEEAIWRSRQEAARGCAARPPCYAVSYCHPLLVFASSPCHLENPSAGGWTSRLTLTRPSQALSFVLVTGLRISVALEISSSGCYCRRQSSCLTMTMTIDPTTTNHPSGSMSYTIH